MTDADKTGKTVSLVIPESLEDTYDLNELINERPGIWTLLVRRKSDGLRCVAKLFSGAMKETGKREADILGRLDHPDIPKLIEYRVSGETGVLIREYAEGKPLDRYVAEKVISEPAIIGIAMKICRVLEYLHGLPEPVIHRDIKPQNIIINDKGNVKLIDFGISRLHNEEKPVDTVFAGTVAYAPPEQYGFRQTDQRADIYSLGMVLQYMLTGSVDTASDKCGIEGSRLGDVIGKCTSFAPEKRFRNIHELYKSLSRLTRLPPPRSLIAVLLTVCILFGGALGGFAGIAYERGRTADTASDDSGTTPKEFNPASPGTKLSDVLGLDNMTEEELLGITGIYIYGDTVFDTLYTKKAADPSGEMTEVNSYISGHPNIIDFSSGPIEISDGSINDISCLKKLKNLKQLVIARNNIWDISPLEGLTQLEFLDLSWNPITDISALQFLTALKELYLNHCSAGDISPVYGLSALEALYVSDNGITKVDGLSALKNLTAIDIGGNSLVNVSVLGKLTGLEKIMIGYNRISDVGFLRSFDRNNVIRLEICGNPLSDTSPLCTGKLFDKSRCVTINAGRLGTVDLSFLGDIDVFDEIRLDDTDCTHLSQYIKGKPISTLVVKNSGLTDISWMENVNVTWSLDISGNPDIKDLSALKKMKHLKVVTVSEDMRPLAEAIADDVSFTFDFV